MQTMECFNELLLKLRELHEREVEGWQVKVQELSNKKGCDTKRMEELFSRNQQMKEQQRLLTDNIKMLENRLRAGLCDRCTVTQEVAKRKQQEFEASQLQSLQHISLLASEINNLNKENKRLRDDVKTLRAALEQSHSHLSSNSSTHAEAKTHSPSERLGSSGPMALITATSKASLQPADVDPIAVKCDADQRTDEAEIRHLRGSNQSHFEPYKPLGTPTVSIASAWKTDQLSTRGGDMRVPSVEGLDQSSSMSSHVPFKNSSSLQSGEVKPSRHVLHAPIPCHPKPIKSSVVPLSWALSESSDWVTGSSASTNSVMPPSPRLTLPRFNSMIPLGQQVSMKGQGFTQAWQKQIQPQPPAKEPTVVFRLSSLPEYESESRPAEKKESMLPKVEKVSDDGLKEACDAPLDLSDRGKSKSSHPQKECLPSALQGGARVQKGLGNVVKADAITSASSPSPAAITSSSCSPPVRQEQEADNNQNQKQEAEKLRQDDEVKGKTDQSSDKKVPVLTISLRPAVVLLETLNSTQQNQEALSSNIKQLPAEEPVSSTDDQAEEESSSGQESSQGSQSHKKKRTSVETQADRDMDTANIHPEKKIKITMRGQRKSPC